MSAVLVFGTLAALEAAAPLLAWRVIATARTPIAKSFAWSWGFVAGLMLGLLHVGFGAAMLAGVEGVRLAHQWPIMLALGTTWLAFAAIAHLRANDWSAHPTASPPEPSEPTKGDE